MKKLGKKLAKRLKSERGDTTQRAFAKKLGIDVATLNRLENGGENITLKTIEKICDNYKCTVGWLFLE